MVVLTLTPAPEACTLFKGQFSRAFISSRHKINNKQNSRQLLSLIMWLLSFIFCKSNRFLLFEKSQVAFSSFLNVQLIILKPLFPTKIVLNNGNGNWGKIFFSFGKFFSGSGISCKVLSPPPPHRTTMPMLSENIPPPPGTTDPLCECL